MEVENGEREKRNIPSFLPEAKWLGHSLENPEDPYLTTQSLTKVQVLYLLNSKMSFLSYLM